MGRTAVLIEKPMPEHGLIKTTIFIVSKGEQKMKYKCENCGAFYSDEDVTEDGEMREDCEGVRFWATFHYCPCCGEEVITDEDYEDTETIEDINKSLYSEWMRQAF